MGKVEALGVISDIIRSNTVKESSTVIPSETFSPLCTGRQNNNRHMDVMRIQGSTMLAKKNVGSLFSTTVKYTSGISYPAFEWYR